MVEGWLVFTTDRGLTFLFITDFKIDSLKFINDSKLDIF